MENKKRCPKCGEENPSDAVMCWACYTPLKGGGAAAQGGASRRGGAAAASGPDDDDDDNGKPAAQPWQIAVIAIGLIFALFMVGKNFLPSGSSASGDMPLPEDPAMSDPGPLAAPAPSPSPANNSGTSSASGPAPQQLPFTVAMAPNPNITIGTMAIVPTNPNISTSQAASLASFTRSQFTQAKRWKTLYIYVFRDQQSARDFAAYQRTRRGAPLTSADYSNLTNLWGSALSCYEYNSNGSARVYTPTNNPNGWWSG